MTDDFCGNCGAYLGWSDGAAFRATAPEPVDSRPPAGGESDPPGPSGAEPSPPEPAATRTPPPKARPAGGEGRTARGTREAESTPQAPPAAAPPATPPPTTPPPTTPQAAAPQAATAPVAFPRPVRPAKAVAPRPVVRPAAGSDDMTGAPCPACGTPNPPDRRFCRRCAAPLTHATASAPLPWWRTIWPFRRRTRAGSGRMVRLMVILAVVLALCAAGFLMVPAGRHLLEDTRDKLGKAKAVTPTRVEASAELPGHPVSHTTDGLSNRYWGAPGPGAWVTYTFAKPFRLVDVIITNGASSSPEEYAKQGRALQFVMEVTARDGQKVRERLTLSDKPGPQAFPTGISDAVTIRLTLDAPAGSAPDRHLALAEVEFFQRS
ncbi:zinc ribbon domain-containing protein [Streptomyces roseus]|uniref:zinc ribbon domain-containing protein n=1 Tax=Streptomyces roseus TaxID=66430 RepID=UPI0036941C5F